LLLALSKLPRSVLPSIGMIWPSLMSCNAVIQLSRHFSNSAGLIAANIALNRSCDREATGRVKSAPASG
jgi:hypothetical protein